MEKASLLPKWELPFAKLTLLRPLWSWAAPHSGRTDALIVWTGPSGRPVLANGKHPLRQTLDVRFWHILSSKLLSFISKHRCDNSIISERLYIDLYHSINTYLVLGQMVRRSFVITLAIMMKYIKVSLLHSNFRPCFIPKMSFISFLRAHRHCQYLPHLVGKVLPNDSREMASTRPRPPLVRYLQQSDSAWHLHAVFRLLTQKHPDCDQICGNSNHLQKPLSHALNNWQLVHREIQIALGDDKESTDHVEWVVCLLQQKIWKHSKST